MNGMMMLLADAAAPAPGGMGGGMGMFVPMILVFGIFYFMMIRPQQRKEKERQRMVSELRVGQKVMFAGGLVGTVAEAREATLMITVAPGVSVEAARGAVQRVIPEGEQVSADPAA